MPNLNRQMRQSYSQTQLLHRLQERTPPNLDSLAALPCPYTRSTFRDFNNDYAPDFNNALISCEISGLMLGSFFFLQRTICCLQIERRGAATSRRFDRLSSRRFLF